MTAADYRRDAPALRRRLFEYEPLIACFQGLTAYRSYLRYAEGEVRAGGIEPGRQTDTISDCIVFVVPNPSPANARYSLADLTGWYSQLKQLRDELKW